MGVPGSSSPDVCPLKEVGWMGSSKLGHLKIFRWKLSPALFPLHLFPSRASRSVRSAPFQGFPFLISPPSVPLQVFSSRISPPVFPLRGSIPVCPLNGVPSRACCLRHQGDDATSWRRLHTRSLENLTSSIYCGELVFLKASCNAEFCLISAPGHKDINFFLC
jgi:hypothetical protein